MAAKRFPYSPTEHGRRRLYAYASVTGKPKPRTRFSGVHLDPRTGNIRLEFFDDNDIEHTVPLDLDVALTTAMNLITAVQRALKMRTR